MILAQDQLQEAVDLIRKRLNPEAIYLSGSQATGAASTEKGDVDLCIIVSDEKEPYRETVDAYGEKRILVTLDKDFGFWPSLRDCLIVGSFG